MPTSREQFEAWWSNERLRQPFLSVETFQARAIWQAAYRAGQEAMRERAAFLAEETPLESAIRALPIDE